MTGPLGQLPEHQLFEILQEKLKSNPCRNQGFVLDGFPDTYDQAKAIFSGEIRFPTIPMFFKLLALVRMSCLCHLDEDALDQDRMFQQPVCNQEITPGYI